MMMALFVGLAIGGFLGALAIAALSIHRQRDTEAVADAAGFYLARGTEDGNILWQQADGNVALGTDGLSHSTEPTFTSINIGDGGEVEPPEIIHFGPSWSELVNRVMALEKAGASLTGEANE